MVASPPEYLVVGHLNKAHGTKGEVFIWPLTDRPEEMFQPTRSFRLGEGETGTELLDRDALRVAEIRPYRKGFLVRFSEIHDRAQAESLRGFYILVPFAELAPREEGEVFYHELLGLEVVTADGTRVGDVTEVFDVKPSELLQVTEGERVLLVPFNQRILREVDLEAGRVVIDPPEGLLDL